MFSPPMILMRAASAPAVAFGMVMYSRSVPSLRTRTTTFSGRGSMWMSEKSPRIASRMMLFTTFTSAFSSIALVSSSGCCAADELPTSSRRAVASSSMFASLR